MVNLEMTWSRGRVLVVLGGLAAVGIPVSMALMIFTSPARLGPVGVTAWFVFSWLGYGSAIALTLQLAKRWLKPTTDSATKRLISSVRQGYLLTGWVVVMLALSSLSQLNPKDIILSFLIVILIEGYFNLR